MWEVTSILTTFDKTGALGVAASDGKLDILEYANNYRDVWYAGDTCTKKEIAAGGPK